MDNSSQLESASQSGGSRYPRLRSMLPKVLLYDNVSLSKQLNQAITTLSIEEKRVSFSWTQLQKRFITQQALKQEHRGMKLLPAIQSAHPAHRLSIPNIDRFSISCSGKTDMQSFKRRFSVPSCSSHGKLDREKAFIELENRPRRRSQPTKDSRFVRLYRLLSDVKLDSHQDSLNRIATFDVIPMKS